MLDLDQVKVWANALIAIHLDRSWTFAFDHAKKRFGSCNHNTRRITISRYLAQLAEDDYVHQVLLHEVAHAIAGPCAGHGPVWLSVARNLGYRGSRTHNSAIPYDLARWLGRCPKGHERLRFRRPSKPVSCSKCHPVFRQDCLIEWIDRRSTA
jgi:SprT protein